MIVSDLAFVILAILLMSFWAMSVAECEESICDDCTRCLISGGCPWRKGGDKDA